jgi:hypothetical protein
VLFRICFLALGFLLAGKRLLDRRAASRAAARAATLAAPNPA